MDPSKEKYNIVHVADIRYRAHIDQDVTLWSGVKLKNMYDELVPLTRTSELTNIQTDTQTDTPTY